MDTISDGPSGSRKLSTSFPFLQNLRRDFLPETQFSLQKSPSYAFYQCLKYKENEESKIKGEHTGLRCNVLYVPGHNSRLNESAIEKNSFKSTLFNLYFDDYFKIMSNAQFEESSFGLYQTMRHKSAEICTQSWLDFSNKDIFSKLYSLSCDFQMNTSSEQIRCFDFYQMIKHKECKLENILETKTPQEGFHPIAKSESDQSIDETASEITDAENESNQLSDDENESESDQSIHETASEITDTENESNQLSDDENDWHRGDTEVFSFIGKNLSVEDFKEMYYHLDMDSLLEVEYLIEDENDWKFMLERKEHDIMCNLCKLTLMANTPTIATHLRDTKHFNIVKDISALYHPTYCAWSDDEESDDYEIAASAFYRSRALKEDMTLVDFKKTYTDMDMYNLLEILYLKNSNIWTNMFEEKNYLYLCNLCDKYQLANFYEVQGHIRGLHHSSKVSLLEALYHPIYLKNSICNITPPYTNLNTIVNLKTNVMAVNQKVQIMKNNTLSNENHRERENLENTSKNITNGKDKPPNLNLFKTSYPALSIENLLKVQYSVDFKHKKFMIIRNGLQYFCNVCNNACLGNESNVRTHIRGANHSMKVESFVEMYDPKNSVWLKDLRSSKSGSNIMTENKQQNITAQNFRSEYINLGVGNFLKIKYKLNCSSKWIPMIICDPLYFGRYICNLCDSIKLKSGVLLRNHIRSISHCHKVSNIADIWHPKYCPERLKLQGAQKGLKNNSNFKLPNKSQNKTENKMMDIREFKRAYINLQIDKLMEVQYQLSNNKWEFMLHEENRRYFCNLCGNVQLGTEFNTKQHIRGYYHSNKVRHLFGLQHPDIFPAGSNKKEFKQTYVDLEIDEIFEVQYQQNDNDWEYMLAEKNDRYFCNLCGDCPLGTTPNVYTHIRGRYHSMKVKNLPYLYHPRYCNYEDTEDSEDDEEASESAGEESNSMLEEFKTTYVDLEIDELLEVEYRENDNDWEYMLTEKNDRYFCNLCGKVPLGTSYNVDLHIRGRYHSEMVQDLKALYHPSYCYLEEDYEESSQVSSEEWGSTLEEFKTTYVDLEIDELLEVEYRENDNDWEYMLTENNNRYFCNLCGKVPLGTSYNVGIHIRGRYHSEMVQNLTGLHHPIYCYLEEDDEESSQVSSEEWEEFKTTYVDLEIDELLEVEYQQNDNDWEYMLTENNDRYFCNLCGKVSLGTTYNVDIHIRGRYHSEMVQDLTGLYHPSHCYFEGDED